MFRCGRKDIKHSQTHAMRLRRRQAAFAAALADTKRGTHRIPLFASSDIDEIIS
jgi:hypothetical protein